MIKNAIQEKYQFVNGIKKKKKKKKKKSVAFTGRSKGNVVGAKVLDGVSDALDREAVDEVENKLYTARNKADAQELQRLIDEENSGFAFA